MNLEKIEKELKDYLREKNIRLYELKQQKKDNILSVILDESLDMDTLETVSRDISDFMDRYEEEMDPYLLDVSTVGIERPIRNREEVLAAVGSYVFVKTKEEKIEGTLVSFEGDILSLAAREKTREKRKNIPYDQVKKMRYAVNF
ncbi:MAG: hypothetical protein IIZ33_03290 [Erysipelotrichaceae bacterium]|nr:hypothetical protein [Erysipelotrichaceae bacterium]